MSIVYEIISKINEELISNRNDVSHAVFVAPHYLNQEMTDDELKEIILFSSKIDQRECPNFKSIYSQEINNAVWSIVCWAICCNTLIGRINEIMSVYTDLKIQLSLEFTTRQQWVIKVENYCCGDISCDNLKSCNCTDLFFESVNAIKKIRKDLLNNNM